MEGSGFLRDGVGKGEVGALKEQARSFTTAVCVAFYVQRIANNRMAKRKQVRANLVRTPRENIDTAQRRAGHAHRDRVRVRHLTRTAPVGDRCAIAPRVLAARRCALAVLQDQKDRQQAAE